MKRLTSTLTKLWIYFAVFTVTLIFSNSSAEARQILTQNEKIFLVSSSNNTQIDLMVKMLRRAIIGQESNYNYSAINPHSGALGFAQVMPYNVRPWSKQALGYEISPKQFINDPQIQLKIIDYKIREYFLEALKVTNGDIDIAVMRVASQWYSGNPNWYKSTRPQTYKGYSYPSINQYCISVLKRFHSEMASR